MKQESAIMESVKLAGRIILENGGETYRVEDTVERMGKAMGCKQVDVFAVPSGVFITLHYQDGTEGTTINRIRKRGINLSKVDQANQVSRQLALGEIDAQEACKVLNEIHSYENVLLTKIQPYAAGFSSAAFAFLFGGGYIEALIACFCAILTQWLIRLFDRYQMHQIVTSIIGGMICTIIPLAFHHFTNLGVVDPMVAGALMPLVPGLAMANAVQDGVRGDLLSGIVHAVNALLIAALIAAGAILAQSIFQLLIA